MENSIQKKIREKEQNKKEAVSITLSKKILSELRQDAKRLKTNLSNLIEFISFEYLLLKTLPKDKKNG